MAGEKLVLSASLSYHEHHGAYYVYHNRIGYLLKMSHDVLGFLEAFRVPMSEDEAVEHFGGVYPGEMVRDFVATLRRHLCLLGGSEREDESLWAMFPVRSRWLVYHAPADPDAALTFVRMGPDRVPQTEIVSGWRRTLWELIDGDKSLSALLAMLRRNPELEDEPDVGRRVLETVSRWVSYDLQLLRLSEFPASMYRQQPHLRQPYLTSVLPYPRFRWGDPAKAPLDEQRVVAPTRYYEHEVRDPQAQFDDVETTLSHLFRTEHPALGGKPYGARMFAALDEHGALPAMLHDVVEVGGGLGFFAKAFLDELAARKPAAATGLTYRIVDLSPALQGAQQERLAEHAEIVSFQAGNAEELDLAPASVDLLLCNEVVGDFTGVRVSRQELGFGLDPDLLAGDGRQVQHGLFAGLEERIRALGPVGDYILKYELPLDDAPVDFYVNLGLFQFLERVWTALRPGGTAVLTEFGEEHQYPVLSLHLDHPELSIHFGHARHVARRIGFDVEFSFVIDLLGFERDLRTLACTSSSFLALRELLRPYGVVLDKLAYTEDMLRAAVGDRVPLEELRELSFEPIEERCMGLVPHQFKALVLKKPA
jgi:hypothetical protein